MSIRRVWLWWGMGLGFLAVLLSASPLLAQTPAQPAVERTMKLAPEGAAAVIHEEVKSQMKDLLAGLVKGLEPNALPDALVKAIAGISEKVDYVDVFFVPSEGGAPLPMVVAHGGLTPEDVNQFLKAVPDVPPNVQFQKKADSIYTMGPEEMPIMLLVGGVDTGLPAGTLVGGPAMLLTNEFLEALGKGKDDGLRQMLQGVDTAAPIWGAARMDKLIPVANMPKTVTGSWYLLGGGKSKMVFEFADANAAEKFLKDFKANAPAGVGEVFWSAMDMRSDGEKVLLVSKTKDSFVPVIVDSFVQARARASRTISMTNLRSIGQGANFYAAMHKAIFPPDLQTLWRDYYKDYYKNDEKALAVFVNPASGKKPKLDEKGGFAFEPDYVYLRFDMAVDKIADPPKTILAYERPENYKNEGTNVLYVDAHVAWVKMDEFNKQLKATQDWIASQEKKDK